jgi:hypothetical protein
MERSHTRIWLTVFGATVAGMLLAGCSPSTTAVIGIPPSSSAVDVVPVNSVDAAVNSAIASQLAQATANQSDGQPAQAQVEIDALNSVNALIRAEAFTNLQATGAKEIAKREGIINTLIDAVQANKFLSGVDPSGRSLSASLLSILSGVDSQLQAVGAQIASELLPDVLRSDVLSIATSTRVGGIYEPMTHLALAGGDELYELGLLSSQEQQLAGEVAAQTGGPNYSAEVSRLSDLESSITSARATIDSALAAVMSLTPASYPASTTTIVNVRSALIQLRSPLGKIGEANADANEIVDLLN